MDEIIKKIKEKKELSGIPDDFVLNHLSLVVKKYGLNLSKLTKSELKIIIKEVRAKLRLFTGRFQISAKKTLNLIEESKIAEILMLHSSSKERLEFYSQLKEIISKFKPKSILDLGCGLNPLAIANKNVFYYASDLNQEHLKVIDAYFEKNKLPGKTFYFDLSHPSDDLPEADLTLLLKVLDIIEKKGHSTAEEIIKKIKSKHIIVSFSTIRLSGKPMAHPKREWFERMLNRLNLKFETIKMPNEIFYIIENKC